MPGLTYLLTKVLSSAVGALQLSFTGVLTLADTIALILRRGIDLSKTAGEWVMRLMRKIMQALGMKVAKTSEDLTKELLESTLRRLMVRTTDEARKAIMRIH